MFADWAKFINIMIPFEPANLSPLPKTPVECSLPYGLTWNDLQPVLPGFSGPETLGAQAYSTHEKQGLNGGPNSCILTLRYPSGKSKFRSETVFMKQTSDLEKMEGQKYQFLASLGIPTPHLLASIGKDDTEVVLLEFLPRIGIDFHSPREVNDLLDLVAQFNAIQDAPTLFKPAPGVPQAEFDERVKAALMEVAQDRSIPITIDIPRWLDIYRIVRTACKSMPLAVSHNELSFQQVGWTQRDGRDQLVLFDLETMWLSPRFTDIAGILPRLSKYTGQNQIELFRIYLDRLRERIPLRLEDEAVLQEVKLVQIKEAFDSLPWHVDLAGQSDFDQMLDRPLSINVHGLHDNLVDLGFL